MKTEQMASTIISRWVDDGTGEGIYRSELEVDYPQLSFHCLYNPEITPPKLNIYVGETRLTGGTENQIMADFKYGTGAILTTPQTEGSVPDQDKLDAIAQFLTAKGMSADQLVEAIKFNSNQNTLWDIKWSLITWLVNNQ